MIQHDTHERSNMNEQNMYSAFQNGYDRGYRQSFQEGWYCGSGTIISSLIQHSWEIVYRKMRDMGYETFEAGKYLSLSSEQITHGEYGYCHPVDNESDGEDQIEAEALKKTPVPDLDNTEYSEQQLFDMGYDIGSKDGTKLGWYQGAENARKVLIDNLWLLHYECVRKNGLSAEKTQNLFSMSNATVTLAESLLAYGTAIQKNIIQYLKEFVNIPE